MVNYSTEHSDSKQPSNLDVHLLSRVSFSTADTEDVCIVERLFSSSLVAIVSLKAPRKLKVCHFKKGTEICNYSYSNTILAVKLNRQVGTGWVHAHNHLRSLMD